MKIYFEAKPREKDFPQAVSQVFDMDAGDRKLAIATNERFKMLGAGLGKGGAPLEMSIEVVSKDGKRWKSLEKFLDKEEPYQL